MNQEQINNMKLENQLCFPLYAVSRLVTNTYTQFLKPFGLTYTQYIVFLVLWEKDGITVGQLCEKLYLDNGTITPIIKKMQTQGYLERKRSSHDDRIVIINLTDKGKELQEKVKNVPKLMSECVELSDDKKMQLYKLLKEFLKNKCDKK
ncbi:MAG: MarR family transcriptional regulator [Finegoldia magna]|uniref:MarR family winged helix-turn-helix transcriptional regulator n=1 Tax=Finegoldia TaxID=150022 RepID=UPI0025CD904E|nr:MarR family transcriptional regulator [Finegoldia magna]MBS5776324.1 MarR family transcriptional regulator [Finegoldia magna]MDU1832564.1 MarR family transcriptional regulator [Finegoldia magna]MDU1878462.1 MarR family transcriptional regulator [Finegoldia magna]MDU2575144.1 MarR family transcriptional regulator [Finegoldia magna]MDU7479568.1 MarR family transcriptional regulator [Finegoldia magna]